MRARGGLGIRLACFGFGSWLSATAAAAPIHLEAPYTLSASGHAPRQVRPGDLDHDGRTDLLVTSRSGIAVLLARGNGHFASPRSLPLGVVLDAALGDVDRDGRLDAVVTLADNRLVVLHGNGDGSFRLDRTLATRVTPRAVQLVDLDADASLDVIVASFGERMVSVYRGRGDGSFEARLDRVLDGFPTAIVSADFDADGNLDLAVTQRGSSQVWILLRDASLLGGRVQVAPFGSDPERLECLDLDADGAPDILGLDPESGAVAYLHGRGDGSFELRPIATAVAPPVALVAGDVDADGIPDLVLGNGRDAELVVGRGDGRGGFQFSARRAFLDPVTALALVDLTQDGRLDLVGVHAAIDRIAVAIDNHGGGFGWRFELPIGTDARGLVAADLDSDGDVDLCSAGTGSETLDYFESEGSGFFTARSIPIGVPGGALVAADFDADGGTDLAVTSGESRVIALRRAGNGWVTHQSIPVGLQPAGLASGDLNGDRIVDLAVTSAGTDRIHVLGGDGTAGFFNLSRPSVVVGPRPAALAVGELNADGKLDVVTANRGADNISVLLGRGGGAFRPNLDLATGSQPRAVAIGDVNGDRRDDLVVANWGAGSLALIFNDVAGLFQNRRYLETPRAPLALRIADLNGDGRNDLIATCDQGVLVFRAIAGGLFFDPETYLPNVETTSTAIGDVTGEGWPDLLVAGLHGVLGVLVNDGTGRFATAAFLPVGTSPAAVTAAELNGDAKTDLAVANSGSNDVSIYFGSGDGAFGAERRVAVGAAPRDVQPYDLDRDGRTDLVVPNSGSRYASILYNRGDHFEVRSAGPTDLESAGSAVADLDADGYADLIVAHEFQDGYVLILRGQSDGGFEWPGDRPTGAAPHGVVSADLNGDNRLDLVCADSGSGTVTVQLANHLGWFDPSHRWRAGPGATAVAAQDLDGDGHVDLAVAAADTDAVAILRGHGDGSFAAPQFAACGDAPVALAIADLDADGWPDVAVANAGANSVSILAGRGDAGFEPAVEYGTGRLPQQVATADLDGDGRIDVVVQNAVGRTLTCLFNRRAMVPVAVANLAVVSGPDGVHIGWELGAETLHTLRRVWVERAVTAAGAWEACDATGLEPRGDMSYVDALPFDRAQRWYRIRVQRADGSQFVSGAVRADPVAQSGPEGLEPLGLASSDAPTLIRYRIVQPSSIVRLDVFDVRGRRIRRLRDARLAAGTYATSWDRTDDRGMPAARGVFLVRLTVDGRTSVRKLTWIGR